MQSNLLEETSQLLLTPTQQALKDRSVNPHPCSLLHPIAFQHPIDESREQPESILHDTVDKQCSSHLDHRWSIPRWRKVGVGAEQIT